MVLGDIVDGAPVLTRVHSECLTGDGLFSQRCDCGAQLETALRNIAAEGRGLLIYLRQEGRGFPADLRLYDVCKPILEVLGANTLRLMTNNPSKVSALEQAGIVVEARIPLIAGHNASNRRYLATKKRKLGHMFVGHDREVAFADND